MATGYTYEVIKNPNMTFNQFAWKCSRAFGAFIDMRDEPMDAPIVLEVKPSDYYLKCVERHKIELKQFEEKSDDLVFKEMIARYKKFGGDSLKSNKDTDEENARLQAMLDKVIAWDVPSDFQNLKDFMMEQLKMSIFTPVDVSDDMEEPTRDMIGKYRADKIKGYQDDIVRYEDIYAEEVERTNKRNEWVRKFRELVGPAPREK